jgi:hypothetical protein
MHKTLHKQLTKISFTPSTTASLKLPHYDASLIALVQEMKSYLQDAAQDLMQPRPQAVDMLLKRAKAIV